MENQYNTAKRFRYKIISYITLIIYLLQPITILLANPQTTVAPNGVEIVEINAPNQNGLSHNQYDQFNVKENGLIFNNSGAIANTTLAGYILGNPNIGTNPARVILNEVMGTQPSYLNGYMEIAGKKAELIIANPNGIVGNGFGFINVSKATLTTGTPTFGNQGTLDGFNVNTGTISIQGQGLNAKEIDRVDLLAKAVEVNAGIWAKQLNVVTGDNVVDTDLNIQSTKQNENSGVALDVGILGGMYADKIKLIGTQNGVGVNSKGTIVATDSLKLNQQGKIFLEGTTLANQELDVLTQDELENQGQLYTNGNLSIQSETITNKNLIAAKQDAKLNSNTITSTGILGAGINEDKTLAKTGSLEIKAAAIALKKAKTYAGKDITIQANQSIENDNSTILANDTTTLIAKENINNTQNSQIVSGKTMLLQAGNRIENNQSSLFSAGDITLQTDNDLINKSGTIEAQKKLTTKAKQLLNDEQSKIISIEGALGANAQTIQNQGLIGSNQTVTLSAADIANQAGKIISQTEINLQAQNTLNNNNGNIQTQKISTIQAKDLQNANGHIEAGQGINLHTNSMQGNGIIQAEQFINVDVNGDYTNSQDSSLKSNGTLNVKATGNIVNQGMMNAVNQIGINGNGLNNAGTITANEKIEIKTLDTFNNDGRIDSNQISLDSNIVHNKGTVIGENLTVNTNDLTNTGSQAILATTQDANLYVKNALDNQDHATIYSLGNIKIAANETGDMANQILNQSATIEAGENIDLSAKEIINKRTEFEMGEKVTVECEEIKKQNPFTGKTRIEKIPKEKEETVSKVSTRNGYTRIYRKYIETKKSTTIEKDSGIATIQAGKDLKIQTDLLTNYVSRILANRHLAIASNQLNNIAVDYKITTVKDGDLMEYNYAYYASPSGGDGGGSNPHTVETTKKIGDYHEEIVELIPGYDSTISGNQSVEINTIGLNNTSTTKTENILENATVIKNTQNTIEDKNATIKEDDSFVLPENGLYHISKTPTSKYLVETDTRFTKYKNFISSDYLLSRIAYPSDKVQKRLGDGFYEQELVKKQLCQKTGSNLLTGYTDGEE